MLNDKTEFVLTDETREIVAAYLAKRQKAKEKIEKRRAEYIYDFSKVTKK